MANLDRRFDIVGDISEDQEKGIKKTLETIAGINHVSINASENTLTIGYTPGIISVQSIKDAIEDQGMYVSDKGDD
jgi:copper chaperone CopZ